MSNMKIQQNVSNLYLKFDGIFLEDEPCTSDVGIVGLHPKIGTH